MWHLLTMWVLFKLVRCWSVESKSRGHHLPPRTGRLTRLPDRHPGSQPGPGTCNIPANHGNGCINTKNTFSQINRYITNFKQIAKSIEDILRYHRVGFDAPPPPPKTKKNKKKKKNPLVTQIYRFSEGKCVCLTPRPPL